MNWWVLLYGFFFALGCLLAYGAYSEFLKTKSLLANGRKTKALVKEYVVSRGDDNDMYQPVFEFKDRNQIRHTYTSTIKSYPPPYKIGAKVAIIHDRRDKSKVKTISFWGLYRGSVILLMIAAPLLVIGGAYLLHEFY